MALNIVDRVRNMRKRSHNNAFDVTNTLGAETPTALALPDNATPPSDEKYNEFTTEHEVVDKVFVKGQETMKAITNLVPELFWKLWNCVSEEMVNKLCVGCEKRISRSFEYLFFMALCYLKHSGNWQNHEAMFREKVSELEKRMWKIFEVFLFVLYRCYAEDVEKCLVMAENNFSFQ